MMTASHKVISASRRIDMVGFFPYRLIEILEKKCPPERVHSIVLWSKGPRNIIDHKKLRETLRRYEQVILHFTISGMGRSFLESGIPSTEESISLLPALIDFLEDPQRLRIRFDPIVHLKLPDGSVYTNLKHFSTVAMKAVGANVRDVIISWMEPYEKVTRRLKKYNIEPIPLPETEWQREADWVVQQGEHIGIHVLGCCVPGFPSSRCIDGELLTILHPDMLPAPLERAKSQRPACRCTESWDIGWYNPCPGRCLYCYAHPVEPTSLNGLSPV